MTEELSSETEKGKNKQEHPHYPSTSLEESGQNALSEKFCTTLKTLAAESKMVSNKLRVQTE